MSVVAAALICAVARAMLDKKTATGRIAFLLSGILMAATVLAPLRKINFSGVREYWNSLTYDAQVYTDVGTAMAEKQIENIIKSQSEAYILDKANRMGLQIAVEVELDGCNGNIPCGVVISGNISPYAQKQLCSYIEDTLGIDRENLKWK